jgi:hypothetical protein
MRIALVWTVAIPWLLSGRRDPQKVLPPVRSLYSFFSFDWGILAEMSRALKIKGANRRRIGLSGSTDKRFCAEPDA